MSGMRLSSRPNPIRIHGDGRPTEEEFTFAAAKFTAGQITSFDSQDIPNEAAVELTNVFMRQDRLSRRSGMALGTPGRPNTNPVLGTVSVQLFDGSTKLLRFDQDEIYLRSATWVQITGAALAGTSSDRFTLIYSNDQTFFSNNGADALKQIDFSTNTYAAAGNAPRYKYWCSFFNRIVGANLAGPTANPIKLGWSGDLNFTEFDSLIDFSAGEAILAESQSDLSDEITGVFAFASTMVVLRQQSVWVATKQPSATNPFAFYAAVPSIGCDAPYSAIQVPNGLIWYDRRTGAVWFYQVGAQAPVNISPPVDLDLASSVQDQNLVFSSYDPYNNIYLLATPISSSNLVRLWHYNLNTGAWWTEEMDGLTSVDNLAVSTTSTTINDLLGVIDDLLGTIDELSPDVVRPTRFYGYNDGTIGIRDDTLDTDNGPDLGLTSIDDMTGSIDSQTGSIDGLPPPVYNPITYTTTIQSKTFVVPADVVNVTKLSLDCTVRKNGSITVSFSKDEGNTWTTYKTIPITVGTRKRYTFPKNIKADRYSFKIESTSGLFDINGYEILAVRVAGLTKQSSPT